MKDNVENIQNMPDNEWNQMLDILRIKIEQCVNYAETLDSLRVYDDNEKKKIKTIIQRTHVVKDGLNKLLHSLYKVWDNVIQVDP